MYDRIISFECCLGAHGEFLVYTCYTGKYKLRLGLWTHAVRLLSYRETMFGQFLAAMETEEFAVCLIDT